MKYITIILLTLAFPALSFAASGQDVADYARKYAPQAAAKQEASNIFIANIYQKVAGIDISGSTAQQRNMGDEVSRTQLQRGDIVFLSFSTGSLTPGIYLGDGEFVYSNGSGDAPVRSLDSGYYKERFVTARRMMVTASPAKAQSGGDFAHMSDEEKRALALGNPQVPDHVALYAERPKPSPSVARKATDNPRATPSAAPSGDVPQSLLKDAEGGAFKIGKPYKVRGTTYTPRASFPFREEGIATWYGPNFYGKRTANNELFTKDIMSAAHKTLPLPSIVRVTLKQGTREGRSIYVRVNDRGPFGKGKILDLSEAAAEKLGVKDMGRAKVEIELMKEETEHLWRNQKGGIKWE